MAAASSNQPGAQNGPPVYVYNPHKKSLTERTMFVLGRNGLPSWEHVIYNKYIDVRQKYEDFKDATNKFMLDVPLIELDNITYKWKNTTDFYNKPIIETVRIHRYKHPRYGSDDPHVIIMHPSWNNDNGTIYIVDDPRFLYFDKKDKDKLIMDAVAFWNGIEGLSKYKKNIEQSILVYHKKMNAMHSGGRRACRTRRTRRTRK